LDGLVSTLFGWCLVAELWSVLMRLSVLLAALAIAAPIGLYAGSASAQFFEGQSVIGGRPLGSGYQGRWCAQENIGGGAVQEDCSFDSFEACRRLVIQGNRGFCGQNPAFRGYREPPLRKKKRRATR
jgi:hypothetical protein